MKRSRANRAGLWAFASAAALVLAALVLSHVWSIVWTRPASSVTLRPGAVVLHWRPRPTSVQPGWSAGWAGPASLSWWWPRTWYAQAWVPGRTTVVPLWIPLVVLGGSAGVVWWSGRGYGPGRCRRCGYDLRGSVGGVCPECGSMDPAA